MSDSIIKVSEREFNELLNDSTKLTQIKEIIKDYRMHIKGVMGTTRYAMESYYLKAIIAEVCDK